MDGWMDRQTDVQTPCAASQTNRQTDTQADTHTDTHPHTHTHALYEHTMMMMMMMVVVVVVVGVVLVLVLLLLSTTDNDVSNTEGAAAELFCVHRSQEKLTRYLSLNPLLLSQQPHNNNLGVWIVPRCSCFAISIPHCCWNIPCLSQISLC